MNQYYYSTQPFIAWIINTYFYNNTHYVYSAPFFPYRLPNPKSSNPYEIYKDLFLPWKDKDVYDKTITSFRLSLRKGVIYKFNSGEIKKAAKTKLTDLCDKISTDFFYPVIYRVHKDKVEFRAVSAGSALFGSQEMLILDLKEDEFDLLFFDEWPNNDLFKELLEDRNKLDPKDVINKLKDHYVDTF